MFKGYAIVPTSPDWDVEQMDTGIKKVIDILEKQVLYANEPKSQYKYSYTIKWLKGVYDQWLHIDQLINDGVL
jgi:hypothetical protein